MKIINSICRISTYISMFMVTVMMLLTVVDVSLRYILNSPIMGTIELTEFLMICSVLGMAQCALEKKHISVDVVTEHLPLKTNLIMEIVVLIPGLALVIILAWQGFLSGLFTVEYGVKSSLLDVPQFPFYVLLSAAFIILCLGMVALIIKRTAELITK